MCGDICVICAIKGPGMGTEPAELNLHRVNRWIGGAARSGLVLLLAAGRGAAIVSRQALVRHCNERNATSEGDTVADPRSTIVRAD